MTALKLDEDLKRVPTLRSGVFLSVNNAVAAAQGAYSQYCKFSLNERKKLIEAVRQKLLKLVPRLAEMTVEETCMGRIPDKVAKLYLAIEKTPGVEDLVTEVETGDNGMTLYELSSYGVACAVHPCTNPCATLINNTIGLLAAGNSVVHIPHPRAAAVSRYLTEQISTAIRDTCGIDNLVVTVGDTSMEVTREVMTHPDVAFVVVTGGAGVLREAMTCGKKVVAAGPANPVCIVDETADLEKAARDIVFGASFDNNLMCVSEKSIVAVSSIADKFVEELKKNHICYIQSEKKMLQLTAATLTQDLTPNKALEGKGAPKILEAAGLPAEKNCRLIVVDTVRRHPFATLEMKMPMIPLIRVPDFEAALETAHDIEQGCRHTAVIHSRNIERLNRSAQVMQTSVFVKNGPSLAGIGFQGEGCTSFTIATMTGEGTTSARHFARRRRCTLLDAFNIR